MAGRPATPPSSPVRSCSSPAPRSRRGAGSPAPTPSRPSRRRRGCCSHLWPYRGIGVEDSMWPMPMGHEYAGIVEEVGDAVTTVKPGQFVVGSFWATDNTCEICRSGYPSACVNRVPMGELGAQADMLRVPLADGTLIATPDIPSDDLVPSLLSASDVLGT